MRPVVKRPVTIRYVTLYIIDRYRDAVPESALSNIMLGDIDVNYFDYREAVVDLDKFGYIHTFTSDGQEYHLLTVSGKELIDEMHTRIAYQLRCEVGDYIKREKRKIEKAKEFVCEIIPTSDVDFSVRATYTECGEELISITFRAGTRETAQAMCDTLKKERVCLYRELNRAISDSLEPAMETEENQD